MGIDDFVEKRFKSYFRRKKNPHREIEIKNKATVRMASFLFCLEGEKWFFAILSLRKVK